MKRQTRAHWEKLVTEVERGRALGEVAERAGVPPKTLAWWRWNLRGPKAKSGSGSARGSKKVSTATFLPVLVRDAVASSPRARIRLEFDNHALVFEDDAAPEYVAALARALARC